MLVAQRDLQVEHALAVALKAEMSRLDHAGVYRADGHFVDLVAVDAEEIGDAGLDRRVVAAAPHVMSGAVGMVEADRLEPRMTDRA